MNIGSHCYHMRDGEPQPVWMGRNPHPAEQPAGLRYQDTNGLGVEGNAPFSTG